MIFRKKTTAYEMVMDFIANLLVIAMSVFCFFYFAVGDRMWLAQDVAGFFAIISVFGLFFVYEVKSEKNKIKKNINKISLDDILVYFIGADKVKNLAIIFLQTVIIFGIPFFNKTINNIDGFQVFLLLVFTFLRHLYIFRIRDECLQLMYATNYERIKDRIFMFFLPAIILGAALYFKKIDIIDQAQALSVFLLQYFWHKYLIRKK